MLNIKKLGLISNKYYSFDVRNLRFQAKEKRRKFFEGKFAVFSKIAVVQFDVWSDLWRYFVSKLRKTNLASPLMS